MFAATESARQAARRPARRATALSCNDPLGGVMNEHDATGRRDAELGELLRQSVKVPGSSPELQGMLEPGLCEIDRESNCRERNGALVRPRRRTIALAAAIAAAIALVL